MTLSGALSIGCLALTGALCTWAIFTRHYDDSLLQRMGLSALAIASLLRIPHKLQYPDTAPEILVAQVGLCLYGVGTAIKLYRRSQRHERRTHRGHVSDRGSAHGV